MGEQKTALILLVILCFAVFSIPEIGIVKAEAQMIVVPDDYGSIQEAIDNASEGDTIFVKGGIYYENVVINKTLSLIGEDKDTTVIDGKTIGPVVLIRHDEVDLKRFTIQNGRSVSPPSYYDWAHAGIHLLHVKNCNIAGNIITNSSYGIWLYGSSDNSIIGNNSTKNTDGILLRASNDNRVLGNDFALNGNGISLESSQNNTLRKNRINDNSCNYVVSTNSLVNDVDTSNKVNDKPIYHLVHESNKIIPSDAGCVILAYCSGVTVQNSTLEKNYYGLMLVRTQNSIIKQNVIKNNRYGILVSYSTNNCISENEITDSFFMAMPLSYSSNNSISGNYLTDNHMGVHITRSSSNDIFDNTIENTSGSAILFFEYCEYNRLIGNKFNNNGEGVRFYRHTDFSYDYSSKFNQIIGNMMDSNTFGISMVVTKSNTIVGNTISNNDQGVYLVVSDNNELYHNNIVDNTINVHAFNYKTYDNTIWDNGYPSGGNYWSDYNGTDADGDGIGDTPYIILGNNQDSYPLMAPITSFDAGTWEWTNYKVDVISNSTFSDLSFVPEDTLIRFNVEGKTGTTGFCRVIVPKDLLYALSNWTVLVDGNSVIATVTKDEKNSYVYFCYNHTIKTVEIIGTNAIPEFPSWTPLLIILVVFLVMVVVFRHNLSKRREKR